jgi:hypothetical protein
MDYPLLPPSFNKHPQFSSIKHKNIIINVEDKNSKPIETQKEWATVLNAASTVILPNFISDQSEYRTKTIFRNDLTYHDISSNGYLEISPLNNAIDSLDEDNTNDKPVDSTAAASIIIYPNPNNGVFQISISEPGDYDIKVFNIIGVPVLKTAIKNDDRKEITLGNTIPSGTYIIHILGKSKKLVEKISIIK